MLISSLKRSSVQLYLHARATWCGSIGVVRNQFARATLMIGLMAPAVAPLHAQERPQDIAKDVLFPVMIANTADANCEQIEVNSNALRIYLLQSEERFVEIGENASRWLGVRYSSDDFSQYHANFANIHGLTESSSRDEFCDSVLQEIESGTTIGGLLFKPSN